MQVETKPKKQNTTGITISGLLVRFLLYSGVATVLMLPYYYNNRAHNYYHSYSSEAQFNIYLTNSRQQEYFSKNGVFADSGDKLRIGIPTETENYIYRVSSPMGPIQTANNAEYSQPSFESVIATAQGKTPYLKNYIGVVFLITEKGSAKSIPQSVLCETKPYSPLPSTMPTISNGKVQCPAGTGLVQEDS